MNIAPGHFSNAVATLLLGWLVAAALGFVAYLLRLEAREFRRRRRIEAEQNVLGLRPGDITVDNSRPSLLALAHQATQATAQLMAPKACPRPYARNTAGHAVFTGPVRLHLGRFLTDLGRSSLAN